MANCKKCGAALPQSATVCEYCGGVAEISQTQAHPAGTGQAWEQGGASPSALRFKRISTGMTVLLAIVTMGLYLSIWFFIRRGQLMGLSPKLKDKGRYLFGVTLGLHVFYLLGVLGYLGTPDPELLGALQMFWYLTWGLIIYLSMLVRSALAELAASRGSSFAGSLLWTIIFNALYLQSQINRMIDARILGAQP
jgi:hypothetical protein